MLNVSGRRSIAYLIFLFLLLQPLQSISEPGRWEKELSGNCWRLWLDREAEWQNDDLYLPPFDIASMPVNEPTCGWNDLALLFDKKVKVPGTVEEYFWSENGNSNGIAGDYRGVSWWSRTFKLDPSLTGKKITLLFESVNLRAEVFLNHKLVGYDVIGNTPFEIDVTDAVSLNGENKLDVRITDPVGTFDWNDENLLHWGNNRVPSVHGFGGITGRVFIRATDVVYIDDIYIQNQDEAYNVNVYATINNSSNNLIKGAISLAIHEWKNSETVIWEKTISVSLPTGYSDVSFEVTSPKARLWEINNPHLYQACVTFSDDTGKIADTAKKRFGFRFFTVGEKDGDKRYYLNGKRVFIFAAMTRGFWPKNGIFPTPEMARRDMKLAQKFGFNMMLYHRAIGQPLSIETADEIGILTYEEPGGYLCRPGPDKTAQRWRQEKLRRMVIRDRSHPSMVIFNLDDLSFAEPTEIDEENIRLVHTLDPSRIVTYNCIISPKIPNYENDPMKLHMLPFDESFYYFGWTSPYHLIRYGCYLDEYYRNPNYYLRYIIDPVADMGDSLYPISEKEIIFYGEEGDIGAPVRLEKIKNELARTGADGWREGEHLDWYASYDTFLDKSELRSSFPTVDDFTLALGKNMHYFHGRILENVRISNKVDAYVLNGWSSGGTRTDLVDAYRYPTGDPTILQHYTQPLYVAVKIRDKVLPKGAVPVADIYIVNEKNLKGTHTLTVEFKNPMGKIINTKTVEVKISGGEEFGQLLLEGHYLPPVELPGYYKLITKITDKHGKIKATGYDDIFVVNWKPSAQIRGSIAVIDTSGVVSSFLRTVQGVMVNSYDPDNQPVDFLVIGEHDYNRIRNLGVKENTRPMDVILDKVANGMTLIILDQADRWAERLGNSVQYTGSEHWGKRGRFFAAKDSVLKGLPQSQGMDWEYQAFYRDDVWGLRLDPAGVQTIIGLASQHNDRILQALCRIPYGNGNIVLSTLRILSELSSDNPQSAVAKKLLMNMLTISK
ncbi:MAG: hypothetical protein JXB48_23920 [Candidatus Latescibacteria bacterium]|nr:hypothetical protein [Candidatus Latescibacterota bacterium]